VKRHSFFLAPLLLFSLASTARAERQLWITNAYGDDVHVYAVDSWQLVRRIPVGDNPHGISATADGRVVHIALEKFDKPAGELLWLDSKDGRILHRVDVGPRPNENECTPDGRWIYVPCDDGQYWIVDGREHRVAGKIKTGGRPHNTLVSADGKRMYLAPMGEPKRVTIVDVDSQTVVGEIPFADSCRPPAMTKDERLFFEHVDNLVGFQVADIGRRAVIKTVHSRIPDDKQSIPTRSHGLCVRPDQQEIWSCNVEHGIVGMHEMASGNYDEIAAVELPGKIYWVCFTPDSKYGFVSVRSVGQIAVIDCATKKIVTMLAAGKEPKRTQVIDVPDE